MDENNMKRLVALYRARFPSSTGLEIESLIAAGLTEAEIDDELTTRRRKYGFGNQLGRLGDGSPDKS